MSTFDEEVRRNIKESAANLDLREKSIDWLSESAKSKYSYNFKWLGRPIIQYPQDILMIQELIWDIQPDLIIETGIAHGGSLILSASILELIGGHGQVLGIDIDIRNHNQKEIEKHPMSKRIKMIQGSSIDSEIVKQVHEFAAEKNRVLVILDSNHTHDHVLQELRMYSPLVTKESYLVVFDTIIEDIPPELSSDRPWDKGNNPKTAVWEFLKENNRFEIDEEIDGKLLISVAPNGYLKCLKSSDR